MIRHLIAASLMILAAAPLNARALEPLTAPAALDDLSTAGEIVILDIRSEREYDTAHLPGAVNAPYPAWRGPAENPGEPISDEALTKVMQTAGLTPESAVVVVHSGTTQTDFGAAARVYWTLKSAGLTDLSILNGGVRAWVGEGLPLSIEAREVPPSTARFSLSADWMATRADVEKIVSRARAGRLIDARPDAFFKGEKKHAAAKAPGTLAGAQNLIHSTWFDGDETMIGAPDRIAALAADAGVTESDGDIVSFCNTGHWAATNWFALSELAGADGVKLYPESMVGWVNSGGLTAMGAPAEGEADAAAMEPE